MVDSLIARCRYARLWWDLGAADVQTMRPSIIQTAVPSLGDAAAVAYARQAAEAFDRRCQAAGTPPPVIVQCMSGAGFIAFATMVHLYALVESPASSAGDAGSAGGGASSAHAAQHAHPLLRDARAARPLAAMRAVLGAARGMVVDSAPPLFQPSIFSRGLLSAMLGADAHGIEERYPVALRTARALTDRYFQVSKVARRMKEVRQAWQSEVPPCPQLYLYSRADPLIPPQHVELFMAQQEARGVEVHAHAWTDSGHCDHLRRHPLQYRQLLLSFTEHVCHAEAPAENWI
eukprot:scaffold10.g2247.t1